MESIEIEINEVQCSFEFDWELLPLNKIVVYVKNVNGVLFPYLATSFFALGIYESTAPVGRKFQLNTYNYPSDSKIDIRDTLHLIFKEISKAIEKQFESGFPKPEKGTLVFGKVIDQQTIISTSSVRRKDPAAVNK